MTPLLTLFTFVPTLVILLLILSIILAPHLPDLEKLQSYECGFLAILGQTRGIFTIHFINVSFLFIVLDLELLLVLPVSISLPQIGMFGFAMAMVFFLILTVGFVLEIAQKVIQLTDIKTGYTVNDYTILKETFVPDNNINNFSYSDQSRLHHFSDNMERTGPLSPSVPSTPCLDKKVGGARKITKLITLIKINKFDKILKVLKYIIGAFIVILVSLYVRNPIYADPIYVCNEDLFNIMVFNYDLKQAFDFVVDILDQKFKNFFDFVLDSLIENIEGLTEAGEEEPNNQNITQADPNDGDDPDIEIDPDEVDPSDDGYDADSSDNSDEEDSSDSEDDSDTLYEEDVSNNGNTSLNLNSSDVEDSSDIGDGSDTLYEGDVSDFVNSYFDSSDVGDSSDSNDDSEGQRSDNFRPLTPHNMIMFECFLNNEIIIQDGEWILNV
jgi:NADH:ubiquinone oxidoreductase subunit 3 (subunit A)